MIHRKKTKTRKKKKSRVPHRGMWVGGCRWWRGMLFFTPRRWKRRRCRCGQGRQGVQPIRQHGQQDLIRLHVRMRCGRQDGLNRRGAFQRALHDGQQGIAARNESVCTGGMDRVSRQTSGGREGADHELQQHMKNRPHGWTTHPIHLANFNLKSWVCSEADKPEGTLS